MPTSILKNNSSFEAWLMFLAYRYANRLRNHHLVVRPCGASCSSITKRRTHVVGNYNIRLLSIWTVASSVTHAVMVICALPEGGGAWIWSPLPYNDALSKEIDARCGKVRHITCPNSSSSRVIQSIVQWSQQYPSAQVRIGPDVE